MQFLSSIISVEEDFRAISTLESIEPKVEMSLAVDFDCGIVTSAEMESLS